MARKLIIFLFFSFCLNANAFFSKFSSFEECVVKEMKGRDSSQTGIVGRYCRTLFPKLKSYINVKKYGTFYCKNPTGGTEHEMRLSKDYINDWKIILRDKDGIEAFRTIAEYNKPAFNARIKIDLKSGVATVNSMHDGSKMADFYCHEK